MYKDKNKEREASKERMRRYRQKGVTEGVTSEGVTQGVTSSPAYHILDKLTDPKWRENLIYLCSHLRQQDKEVTWLGEMNLSTVCDWLQCTS